MSLRALVATTAAALVAAVAVLSPPAPAAPAGTTLEITASRGGFAPASATVRRAETVHVVLTSKDGEHCFAIDELRIEKRIVPGRPTRFDLVADRPGTYVFHCCVETGPAAERERGELVVGE